MRWYATSCLDSWYLLLFDLVYVQVTYFNALSREPLGGFANRIVNGFERKCSATRPSEGGDRRRSSAGAAAAAAAAAVAATAAEVQADIKRAIGALEDKIDETRDVRSLSICKCASLSNNGTARCSQVLAIDRVVRGQEMKILPLVVREAVASVNASAHHT